MEGCCSTRTGWRWRHRICLSEWLRASCDLEVDAVFCTQKWQRGDQVRVKSESLSMFIYGVDSSSEKSTHPSCKTPAEGVFSFGFFAWITQSISFLGAALKAQRSALRAVLV